MPEATIGNALGSEKPWYNYRTEQYDYLSSSPEDYSDYVPQIGGRGLYQLYVEMGVAPAEAAIMVMKMALGLDDA